MASRRDPKGRSTKEPKHVRLYDWFLNSQAWQACSVYERCLYIALKQRYNGLNNGAISLSYLEAQEAIGCSNKPIPVAFRGLQEKGFIRPVVIGSFHWKTRADGSKGKRATEWLLTEYQQDEPIRSISPATKDFMKWRG